MSLDSDVIVDRRRIRRKLTFWRVAAAVVAIAAVVTVGVIAARRTRLRCRPLARLRASTSRV